MLRAASCALTLKSSLPALVTKAPQGAHPARIRAERSVSMWLAPSFSARSLGFRQRWLCLTLLEAHADTCHISPRDNAGWHHVPRDKSCHDTILALPLKTLSTARRSLRPNSGLQLDGPATGRPCAPAAQPDLVCFGTLVAVCTPTINWTGVFKSTSAA